MALLVPYLKIIFSSVCVYLFIVLGIRLFGKKELAQLSVVDLVFILLISNAVQNAMVGNNTSLPGGLMAAGALFGVNYVFKFILYRFPSLGAWVQGEAVLLIYQGKIHHSNLEKNQITPAELMEAVREHGVSSVKEVDLAMLEVDGNISVLSHDFTHKTLRKHRGHKIINKQLM
jgi:uncharacterized membrane protein YcaP (DUF421 family)